MRATFRQLEYAVAVADHLHFRRAAEACHVSQPALSNQIQQLEDALGVRLFERGRRGVLVTQEGEVVLERARRCLHEVRGLIESAESMQRPFSGPLRLGAIPTVAPYLLPRLVPLLRETHPAFALTLQEDQTWRLVQRLRAGEVDLLLLALPLDEDDLTEWRLFDEAFVLLAPENHELAERRRVRQSDLAGREILLLEDGHCLRDQALELCGTVGASGSTQVRANSLGTLAQLVDNGLGMTLLPETAIPAEAAGLKHAVWRRFDGPSPTRSIGLVWRRASAHDAEYRRLGTLLEKSLVPPEGGPGSRERRRKSQ